MSKYFTILLFCMGFLALGFTKPVYDSTQYNPLLSQDSTDTLVFDPVVTSVDDSLLLGIDTVVFIDSRENIVKENADPTVVSEILGTASYYHNMFVGRPTATGAIFSQKKMTCAHRTIPLGTKVRVTNLDNNKSVVLLVNDRMGKSRHEIDLTRAAAKKLNFIKEGWVNVKIEVLKKKKKD